MKSGVAFVALALQAAQAPAPGLSQECQIETVTLCDQAGCRGVEPTLKLYLGEFTAEDGRRFKHLLHIGIGAAPTIAKSSTIHGSPRAADTVHSSLASAG